MGVPSVGNIGKYLPGDTGAGDFESLYFKKQIHEISQLYYRYKKRKHM
jgi:hypothetical protein